MQAVGPQDQAVVLPQRPAVLHRAQRLHGGSPGGSDGHPPLALLLLQALDGLGLHSQL